MRARRGAIGRGWIGAALALLTTSAGTAEAQFGIGGFGFGYGYHFNYHPEEVRYLNQRSLQNAARATMGPVQNNVYAGNPNAYVNHLDDRGNLEKYDVATRRTIEARIGRYSDGPPPGRTAPSPAPAPSASPGSAPRIAPATFFERYRKLAWPDDAPTFGLLGGLRSLSDASSLAVLDEYGRRGLARLSTVTEARSRLLDYGRAALVHLRENATPRVADGFHLFLLSLYESLAQAATVAKTPDPVPEAAPAGPRP